MGHVLSLSVTMTSPVAVADEFARAAAESSRFTNGSSQTAPRDNTTLSENDRPDIPSPAYKRMEPRWSKCRALMAGTEAIRADAARYLVQLPNETNDAFQYRAQLVALFNAFKRTVKACVGLITQEEPKLGDDMPQPLVDMWENADRGGTHGAVLTKQLVTDGMIDGSAGIFTDYPRVANPGKVSADDEQRGGLRPYFVRYRAQDVLKTIYQSVDGVRTLVLLVLRETSDERVGQFGIQTVERYRAYTNERGVIGCEVWKKNYNESAPRIETQKFTLANVTKIPWSPLVAGDVVDANETRPPLDDLADLNVEHFQIKTNIRYLEDRALVPTMVRIGAQPDEDGAYPPIAIGPQSAIEAPVVEGLSTAPIYWLSPDVAVLDPSNKSLEKVEQQMGAAGLAFLAPDTRAAETAEAKRIDEKAQNASLRSVARDVQDCLESAFGFAGQYIKQPAGSVTVNADFEETVMDPAMVAELRNLATAGKLSIETLLDRLEKGHVLDEGFDIEAEVKRILTENAQTVDTMRGNQNNNAGQGDGGGAPPAA
jgi:hypothetical protein